MLYGSLLAIEPRADETRSAVLSARQVSVLAVMNLIGSDDVDEFESFLRREACRDIERFCDQLGPKAGRSSPLPRIGEKVLEIQRDMGKKKSEECLLEYCASRPERDKRHLGRLDKTF